MAKSNSFQKDSFLIPSSSQQNESIRRIPGYIYIHYQQKKPGLTVGRDQPMVGLRGTSNVKLFFDQIELELEFLLGTEGAGLKIALETLGRVRLS